MPAVEPLNEPPHRFQAPTKKGLCVACGTDGVTLIRKKTGVQMVCEACHSAESQAAALRDSVREQEFAD